MSDPQSGAEVGFFFNILQEMDGLLCLPNKPIRACHPCGVTVHFLKLQVIWRHSARPFFYPLIVSNQICGCWLSCYLTPWNMSLSYGEQLLGFCICWGSFGLSDEPVHPPREEARRSNWLLIVGMFYKWLSNFKKIGTSCLHKQSRAHKWASHSESRTVPFSTLLVCEYYTLFLNNSYN